MVNFSDVRIFSFAWLLERSARPDHIDTQPALRDPRRWLIGGSLLWYMCADFSEVNR